MKNEIYDDKKSRQEKKGQKVIEKVSYRKEELDETASPCGLDGRRYMFVVILGAFDSGGDFKSWKHYGNRSLYNVDSLYDIYPCCAQTDRKMVDLAFG